MRKILNKVLATLAAVALTLPTQVAFAGQFSDVADSASYSAAVTRLASLGIMQGNAGTFNPDANITRAEVTKVIDCTLGYDSIAKSTKSNQFSDIKTSDWFSGYANYAAVKGMIKGYVESGKKIFKPQNNMTMGEFVTLAIRALGYTDSDVPGTWPMNYMSKGSDLNLFNGLDLYDPTEPVKRSEVAVIVNNLLDTPTKTEQFKKDNATTDYTARSLFTIVMPRLGYNAVTGILTTSATDPTIPAGQVQIGNTNYPINMTNQNDLLKYSGYIVNVYVRKGSIVSINSTIPQVGSAISVTANADAISTTSGGVLSYLDGSNIQRTININSNAKIYVNGVVTTNPAAIKNGATVYAVQQQANETGYDYVVATQTFGPYVQWTNVTSNDPVSTGQIGQLVQGQTSTMPAYIYLKKADGSASNVVVTGVNGAPVTKLSDIQRGDVLYSSATSDNSLVRIQVVRSSVTGKVTGITNQITNGSAITPGIATINNVNYNIRPNAGINIALSDSYKYILDINNTIVGVDTSAGSAGSYNVNYDNIGIVEGGNQQQSFGAPTYQVRIKKLDGTEITLYSDNYYQSYTGQMVYYTINSNNVVSIPTPSPNTQNTLLQTNTINRINITPNTKIYNVVATPVSTTVNGVYYSYTIQKLDYNTIVSSTSSLNVQAFYLPAPSNTLGDYALVAFCNLPAVSSTSSNTYTIVPSVKSGSKLLANGASADYYNAFVNGKATELDVATGNTLPQILMGYSTDSNGLVNQVSQAQLIYPSAGSDTVSAIDSTPTNPRIRLANTNNATVYQIDANAKVYNTYNSGLKVDYLTNVLIGDAVRIVVDPSSQKVVMIILNKAD